SHGSACDHDVQRKAIEAMAAAGLLPAIGLEMVPVDQAPVLKLFNQRRIAPEAMGRALLWSLNWGFPFGLYRPIFETAERWNLPVVALNVPPTAAFVVADRNAPLASIHPRSTAPEQIIPPSPRQLAELREEFEAHREYLGQGADDFDRFALVQAMWDSMMAEEALRAVRDLGRPVVVLAGAGHVEALGIPYRLHLLAPEVRVLTVLPWRGGAPPNHGESDLHYFCPVAME
ncbi:MAG: ChaN family lipoprotein, partial [Deltaproteobacteria bacterium]|nr:ChaN family lipoprotein [Deltaproteobacteria bacterium]